MSALSKAVDRLNKRVWRTKNGREIKLSRMDYLHVVNARAWLERGNSLGHGAGVDAQWLAFLRAEEARRARTVTAEAATDFSPERALNSRLSAHHMVLDPVTKQFACESGLVVAEALVATATAAELSERLSAPCARPGDPGSEFHGPWFDRAPWRERRVRSAQDSHDMVHNAARAYWHCSGCGAVMLDQFVDSATLSELRAEFSGPCDFPPDREPSPGSVAGQLPDAEPASEFLGPESDRAAWRERRVQDARGSHSMVHNALCGWWDCRACGVTVTREFVDTATPAILSRELGGRCYSAPPRGQRRPASRPGPAVLPTRVRQLERVLAARSPHDLAYSAETDSWTCAPCGFSVPARFVEDVAVEELTRVARGPCGPCGPAPGPSIFDPTAWALPPDGSTAWNPAPPTAARPEPAPPTAARQVPGPPDPTTERFSLLDSGPPSGPVPPDDEWTAASERFGLLDLDGGPTRGPE